MVLECGRQNEGVLRHQEQCIRNRARPGMLLKKLQISSLLRYLLLAEYHMEL
jgi:hypothetical protein